MTRRTWGPDPAAAPIVYHAAPRAWSRASTLALVADLRTRLELPVQVFRADRIVGPAHLVMAAAHARRAMASGRARTQDEGLEAALYAAGDRQIHRALEAVGVPFDGHEVPVLVVPLRRVDEQTVLDARAVVEEHVALGAVRVLDLADAHAVWPELHDAEAWWRHQTKQESADVDGLAPSHGAVQDHILARMALLAVDKA